uniref:Uncharacterized protein n=1 Tax=Aegilops tauschii subsp. strangulata TaxID=200361 RepID=A0A453ER36_AEGTS
HCYQPSSPPPRLTTPPALPLPFRKSPAPAPAVPPSTTRPPPPPPPSPSPPARATSPSAPSPSPSPPADGVGPAALKRGDVYLGRQLVAAAAMGARTRAPEEDAERRRCGKEKRRAQAKKTPSGVACCYGGGAPLRTIEEGSPGHVEPATYDLEEEAQPTEDRAMRAVQAAVARKVFDKMTK